jgi:hypothetical protein
MNRPHLNIVTQSLPPIISGVSPPHTHTVIEALIFGENAGCVLAVQSESATGVTSYCIRSFVARIAHAAAVAIKNTS